MTSDISSLIGAVTREVRSIEYEGKPARVVVAARSYDTDIDDLWDAISNPERLPRWFAPVSGDFELGGKYQITGNASGTITRCEPPRELALTWEFGGGVSWVTVSLREEGGATRLELHHIAHPEAHWDQFGPAAVGIGWELGLMGLARHIETPAAAKPPEADEAWMASAEAKLFIRLSAEGWRDAAIAGGDDPAWAAEAAERTRKFYSGEA
ncbi:MAG TPA: SRPBCC family protein [Vitreimonas sp.]|uniref:SRPBCC family protein n=1 Tax=Vitreimonas sp. TaxID=3069702 RepID=UPI002D5F19BF|nr:SRPBCC family protein [Vitreimonas sp.]HYD87395.1 SRPBCC family protein [Vitreimonas sp.]